MERSDSVVHAHVGCLSRDRDVACSGTTGVTVFSRYKQDTLIIFCTDSAKRFTVQQNNIYNKLTFDLFTSRVHFRGMTVEFLSCHWTFIALNSVSTWVYCIIEIYLPANCIIEIYLPARMMPKYCLAKLYFVGLSLSKDVNLSMH